MSQSTPTQATLEQDHVSIGSEESPLQRGISKAGRERMEILDALEELGIQSAEFQRPGGPISAYMFKYDEDLIKHRMQQGNVRTVEFHQKRDDLRKRFDEATTPDERDQVRAEFEIFIQPIRYPVEWLALWVKREVEKNSGHSDVAAVYFDVERRCISFSCDATYLLR